MPGIHLGRGRHAGTQAGRGKRHVSCRHAPKAYWELKVYCSKRFSLKFARDMTHDNHSGMVPLQGSLFPPFLSYS